MPVATKPRLAYWRRPSSLKLLLASFREQLFSADFRHFQLQHIVFMKVNAAGGAAGALHHLGTGVSGDAGEAEFGFALDAGQVEDLRGNWISGNEGRKQGGPRGAGSYEKNPTHVKGRISCGDEPSGMSQAMILGCGFTGGRVARLLRARGWDVSCANRSGTAGLRVDVADQESLRGLRASITPGTVILHSIPVPGVMEALRASAPARVVYLSTTGVYGPARVVDEHTEVNPRSERERLRVVEEQAVMTGPWTGMVLRPAAIYGPGRGIHSAMRAGTYRLMGEGGNFCEQDPCRRSGADYGGGHGLRSKRGLSGGG